MSDMTDRIVQYAEDFFLHPDNPETKARLFKTIKAWREEEFEDEDDDLLLVTGDE